MSTPETGPAMASAEPATPLVEAPITAAPIVGDAPAPVEVPAEPAAVEAPVEPDAAAVPAEPVVEPAAEPAADAEVKPEPQAREPVAFEPWKLPESLALDDTQNLALNGLLNEFGLSQDQGQRLVDFAAPILQRAQENLVKQQIDAFAETRRGFVKEFDKQAGNRRDTILGDAKAGLKDLVPNAKDRAELLELLDFTGAGDNRRLIGAFANHGKKLREGPAPNPANPTPPNASPEQRRYRTRA